MNTFEKVITIILAIVIIAASVYVISTVPWFDLNPCPAGTEKIVTVWVDQDTHTARTDKMCIEAEQ